MRLTNYYYSSGFEDMMQEALSIWLQENDREHLREFHVGQVGRRADFLVRIPTNAAYSRKYTLVNIEAKCDIIMELINQLDDHAKYCDYCYAYIPDFVPTPQWFKGMLTKRGYGLLIYNYRTRQVTEALSAHYNRGRDTILRRGILKLFEERFKNETQPVHKFKRVRHVNSFHYEL